MFDPAALGTAMIGLGAVRAQTELDESGATEARPRWPTRPHRSFRMGLAVALRSVADRLAPSPVGGPKFG